jgi:hypothetical protein
MGEALGKNCENAAVLQRRYENFCLRLSQSVETRLLEWIACKEAKKYYTCHGGSNQ